MQKPHQLEAERAVIKCLFENIELLYESKLKPEMFFGIDNAIVYKTILDVTEVIATPDVVLIKNNLRQAGQFDAIGGEVYFEQIATSEALPNYFEQYTTLVRDAYISRMVIETGQTIANTGYIEPAAKALDVVFSETSRLLDISSFNTDSPSIMDLMAEEMQAFLERLQNPGCEGIHTGFADYDLLTGGMFRTDEVIIAARPSVGKTSLALNLLLNLAKHEVPGLLFSYEMSDKQLMQRLLSMESGVGYSKIKSGMVVEEEYNKVSQAANIVGKLPIFVSSNNTATISDIVAESRKLVRSKGVGVVVVDYLQLMPHRTEYATQDLGAIARRLKNLAMDADILTIALSQLNRLVEMRLDKIPILSDLRQSGNIEEHADVVIMLHREEMYNSTDTNRGAANMFIRKNRNGPIGTLPLRFSANIVSFSSG